jgi:Secretion system C-terminal sorting domain
MKTRFPLFFFVLLLTTANTIAQTSTWYFGGNAGLKFIGSTTTPISGSSISTNEGCTVINDAVGNVIMYTDGITIWNGAHISQTGSAGMLGGNPSSTQAALMIPIPGQNCGSFFIFTTQAVESDYGGTVGLNNTLGSTGLRVSLATVTGVAPSSTVTITASNRNQNLTSGVLMSERLTATEDGTGGFWVIAHGAGTYGAPAPSSPLNTSGETNFYTVHITASTTTIASLSATATSFPASPHNSWSHPYPGSTNSYQTQGQMKINAAGTRIGIAMSYLREVQLYDFNSSTGVISNQYLLNTANFAFDNNFDATVYGLEFSPNGNVLYVSTTFGGQGKCVYQFDLTASNIPASALCLANATTNYTYGQMQLGPNGRIYIAKFPTATTNMLDVINNPDVVGSGCNYAPASVLIGGFSRLGLPNVLSFNPCGGKFSSTEDELSNAIGTMQVTLDPASGNLTVQLNVLDESGEIQLFNSIGELVLVQAKMGPVTTINTSTLATGVYIVTYQTTRSRISQKLVIGQ